MSNSTHRCRPTGGSGDDTSPEDHAEENPNDAKRPRFPAETGSRPKSGPGSRGGKGSRRGKGPVSSGAKVPVSRGGRGGHHGGARAFNQGAPARSGGGDVPMHDADADADAHMSDADSFTGDANPPGPAFEFDPDSACPEQVQIDCHSAPRRDADLGFSITPFPDRAGLLLPSANLMSTMAGAQKCMRMLSPEDVSLYTQPHEGATWAFVARCVGASVPLHIEKAMYFFYRLASHMEINGLTEYVTPTPQLHLLYDRQGGKRVIGVSREVSPNRGMRAPVHPTRPHCFRQVVNDDFAGGRRDTVQVPCVPLTMRMGFTGALCETVDADGLRVLRQELFCVLFVTPLRNVDVLAYIHQCFLVRTKTTSLDSKQREGDVNELEFIWRTLLQYEAYQNLGLGGDEGDPFNYSLDSGGVLGADMLLSVVQIPIKINEVAQKLFASPRLSRMSVIGLPALDFAGEGPDMQSYMAYALGCVQMHANDRRNLAAEVARFGTFKPNDRFQYGPPMLRCPGGWPLRMHNGRFTEFGLPRLPIMLTWGISKNHVQLVTFDSFKLNSGGLPLLAMFVMRKFLAFDLSSLYRDGVMDPVLSAEARREGLTQDEAVIKDNTEATPLEISIRYYGEQANPLQNLVTAGCLRGWWSSMRDHVHAQRKSLRMSPAAASQCYDRYLSSCMESHRGMILSKAYRSLRIEQVTYPLDIPVPHEGLRVVDQGVWGHLKPGGQALGAWGVFLVHGTGPHVREVVLVSQHLARGLAHVLGEDQTQGVRPLLGNLLIFGRGVVLYLGPEPAVWGQLPLATCHRHSVSDPNRLVGAVRQGERGVLCRAVHGANEVGHWIPA